MTKTIDTIDESEVRHHQSTLKGVDTVMIEHDEGTGKVVHAEIHSSDALLWKWPPNAKTRYQRVYEESKKKFSLVRKDPFLYEMERDMVV